MCRETMPTQTVLVGLGDSSFKQLPCASACCLSHEQHRAACSCSNTQVANGCRTNILQISCGRTAAVALVSSSTTADSSSSSDNDNDTPRLLEWGTGLYGEKLSLPATPLTRITPGAASTTNSKEDVGDDATLRPEHPAQIFSPLVAAEVIRFIACGAHFVVASVAHGGCITWGGDGGRELRTLGRGGCGINSCQSCQSSSSLLCDPCCVASSQQPAADSSTTSSTTATRATTPGWVSPPLGPRGLVVTALAAGDDHTIAASTDGKAWAWGRGDCGQLGSRPTRRGTAEAVGLGGSCVPTMVELLRAGGETTAPAAGIGVKAVACGRDHSALLTEDGRLWTFGSGLYGQVGRQRIFRTRGAVVSGRYMPNI